MWKIKTVLDKIAAERKGNDNIKWVLIEGHTDSKGPAWSNYDLSVRRAKRVKAGLIERDVSKDLLKV